MFKIPILGVSVDFLSMAETIAKIRKFLKQDKRKQIITFNSEMAVRAQKDREFKKIINRAALVLPDGIGLIWAGRLLSMKKNEKRITNLQRIAGVDLVYEITKKLKEEGKFFLFGSKENVAHKTGKKLAMLYPGIKISGTASGYNYTDEDIIEKINKTKANVLFVGIGSPKQEKWINKNLPKMPFVKIAVGVGGTFDFISNRIRRAPLWVRTCGLEWFWRLLRQPWRLGRIYNAVIIFPYLIIKDKLKTF
jgi:N-acetylglucosaminyldiphosphoundecaprenol N-acetyl-beta-D-mannosaminyltransferase